MFQHDVSRFEGCWQALFLVSCLGHFHMCGFVGKHVQARAHNAMRRRLLQSKKVAKTRLEQALARPSRQGHRLTVAAGLNPPSTFQPAAIIRTGVRKRMPVQAPPLWHDPHVPNVANVASRNCIQYIPYERFSGIRDLSRGAFGVVVRAQWGPQSVVLKKFKGIPSVAAKNACREIENNAIGKACPYVIVPIAYTWGPKNREPCLVYEYGGRTLWQLSEASISTRTSKIAICHKLCEGLAGLHQSGMIHADLKGDNVLYRQSTGILRLIDLGVAMSITADIKNPKIGKEGFARRYWHGPEFETSKTLSVAIDAFAVGFLLLDLLVPLTSGKKWTVQPGVGLVADVYDKNIEAYVLSCFEKEPTSRPLLHVLAQLFKDRKYDFVS
jgi:hypothetical protein